MQPMAGLFSQNERHPAFSMVSLCRENTRLNMRDIPSVFPSLLHPHPGQPCSGRKQNQETLLPSPDDCHKTRKPLTIKHRFIHIWSSCRPEEY